MNVELESVCHIKLSNGMMARVDNEDWWNLRQYKWQPLRGTRSTRFCATRHSDEGTVYMHREILGLGRGDKRQGDHKNLDSLDNRRSNLRIVDNGQNQQNREVTKRNKLGIKGVWEIPCGFRAGINANGRVIDLGCFRTIEEASAAYTKAALLHHGEYARVRG